ncbi:MAG: GumC family protein [Negativicutes bacterium]|nr:GumC family protein [Negativicutes bacterium]
MDEKTIDLKEFIKVVKKRQKIIKNVFMAIVLTVAIISFIIPSTYEAETTLRIKQPKGLGDSLLADLPMGSPMMTKQQMATYAEILKSRTVVQAVIDITQINKEEPPEYEDMLKRITTQQVKDTEILKVTVKAKSPAEAQYVANTLVETFLSRMTNLVRSEQTVVREFIGDRLQESKRELERAEAALEQYKREQKIVAPEEETKAMVDRLASINGMVADNAVGLASSQAKLSSVQDQIGRQNPGFIADSPLIQQYKGKLAELEVELVGLKQNYTDKHPRVMATRAAIAETKNKLNTEIARVISAEAPSMNPIHLGLLQAKIQSEAEIAAAVAQRSAIDKILAQGEQELFKLPSKEQGLARVMRDTLTAQDIYSMLSKRYEEARISEVMQPTDVQVIDVAVTPEKPVSPRKLLNVVIAAILGLFAGTSLAFIQEYLNRTVRNTEDVKRYLDLPVLGSIPEYEQNGKMIKNIGLWQKLRVRFGL